MPANWLRFVIILTLLAACSSTAPLQPTATVEMGITASIPASPNTPSSTARQVSPESTTTELPMQPAATEASAAPPIIRLAAVDQSSIVDTSRAGWWSIKTLGPIGQTFRPSFSCLDAIGLWTEDQRDAECSGTGARLQVNIREATIEGPLVGASSPAVLPDCFKGVTYFGFPTLVALTPAKVYVIEVVVTSEENWGVVWQQVPDSYPRGNSIVLGISGNADLWFQEGLRNSTPLTEAYCRNNLWQHVIRSDGSTFKDQSDCTRYASTGQ